MREAEGQVGRRVGFNMGCTCRGGKEAFQHSGLWVWIWRGWRREIPFRNRAHQDREGGEFLIYGGDGGELWLFAQCEVQHGGRTTRIDEM